MAAPIIGLAATIGANESGSNVDFLTPTTISVPSYEVAHVETTNLSTTSGIRTFIPGLLDPGMLNFSMQYTNAMHARLVALKGVSKTWKIVIATDGTATTTVTLTGFLVKHELEVEADKIIMMKGEVKISGSITIA